MYSISSYGRMIADKVRMEAYAAALRLAIDPGSIVADIGTGTGICALLACQFGARRVYAIEPSDVIQVAREIAAANGLAERIEFVQKLSTDVNLPEKVDVIVSDLRGTLPLFGNHLKSIVDARKRLLGTTGALIPERDTLWTAVVEAPEIYSRFSSPWDQDFRGLDMRAARRLSVNAWEPARVKSEHLVVEPQCWGVIDYTSVEGPDVSGKAKWTASEPATGHGIAVWFDTVLSKGVSFSNAPGRPDLIYGCAFLPWLNPVRLAPGDTISVTLKANLVGKDYVWRWNTEIRSAEAAGALKASFKQSTFYGAPISISELRKRSADYAGRLNSSGKIDHCALTLLEEGHPLGDIATQLHQRHPDRFVDWHEALTHVGELAVTYCV